MQRQRLASFILGLALAVAPAIAQRRSWTVDPAVFTSADFRSLQAAADSPAVAAGDILLLAGGNHGSLNTSKPLVILGDPAAILAHIAVHDIPAGSEFVLRGMTLHDPAVASFALVEAVHCAGRIVVADPSLLRPGSFPQFELRIVLATAGCADVELAELRSLGGAAYFADSVATVRHCNLVPESTNPGFASSSALTAHQSTVEVVDTQVAARPYTNNSPGARIIDGVVRFRGATAVGGNGLPGGVALWVAGARIEFDPQVAIGSIANTGGTIVSRSLPALAVTRTAVSAQATLTTDPGAPAFVAFGLARTPVDVGLGGMLRLDTGIGTVTAGVGSASRTVVLPSSRALVGVAFAAQGAAFVGNEFLLSNGAALLIL